VYTPSQKRGNKVTKSGKALGKRIYEMTFLNITRLQEEKGNIFGG